MPRGQGGRPPTIGREVVLRDGSKMPAVDRIVQLVRAGNYFETACLQAGVPKRTAQLWVKTGVDTRAALEADRKRSTLTAYERQCMAFADALEEAEAEAEAEDVARLQQLGRGGVEQVVITEKVVPIYDEHGNETGRRVVERTERKERSAPDARVLQWRLERRFPKRWGRRQQIEVSGPEGGAIQIDQDQRVLMLVQQLRQLHDGGPDGEPPALEA